MIIISNYIFDSKMHTIIFHIYYSIGNTILFPSNLIPD